MVRSRNRVHARRIEQGLVGIRLAGHCAEEENTYAHSNKRLTGLRAAPAPQLGGIHGNPVNGRGLAA